jgi:hypothetical protein
MFSRLLNSLLAVLLTTGLLTSCGGGGSPAAAPSGLAVQVAESTATISWNAAEGVEYWLFYSPTSVAPASVSDMGLWIRTAAARTVVHVNSPFVLSGLPNGSSYSFTVNSRVNGGPGGAGATPVTATPKLAGSNWTVGSASAASGKDLRAVAFGTVFAAGGADGAMASSADGITWATLTAVTANSLNAASFYTTYKLVGDNGTVITSADAITWTPRTSGTAQHLYGIAANGTNLNVAVGANGTVITSADGTTWTTQASGTTRDLYAVTYSTYNGGVWVAVGAGGTIIKSADAVTWTAVASNTTADLRGVANGIGSTVTAATTTTTTTTFALAFTAVGAAGTVVSSADGTTWVAQTLAGSSNLNAVSFGTQFVAVGNAGSIFNSTDGTTWAAVSPAPTSQNLLAVARGILSYAAVGAGGVNLLSK